MGIENPDDLERVDRQIRINELKEEAREAAGGEMLEWESEDCPDEVAEAFWGNVAAFETAPDTSSFQQLLDDGLDLPPPETLDDEQLSAKLWEVIHALARRRTFLSCTDHLNDRELYTLLGTEVLHELSKDIPPELGWNQHIDILGSGSEEDTYLYLKHYANEEERGWWAEDFPGDKMPDHVDPPYDRDRLLPKSPDEQEDNEGTQ